MAKMVSCPGGSGLKARERKNNQKRKIAMTFPVMTYCKTLDDIEEKTCLTFKTQFFLRDILEILLAILTYQGWQFDEKEGTREMNICGSGTLAAQRAKDLQCS